MSTAARTDTDFKLTVSEDGKTATLVFDLSDPTSRPRTKNGTGKAFSLAGSHGWLDVGSEGVRLSFNLVLSEAKHAEVSTAKAELAAANAELEALRAQLAAATAEKPAASRARKAA